MRSNGGCTFQQALTPDAAAVVKQAVALARRRGHAQVTPLHVASTMLSSSSSSGLLRAACQQSHSHPLQCRALELCFNVALNRLPTTASVASPPIISPMLGPTTPVVVSHGHHQAPSISNALVAAFKRAQAHQRRGSIENQQQAQQTILAVKIEVEQLVISILDDPSVSRVMREAGFSSTLVKAKVEQAVTTTRLGTTDQKSTSCIDINISTSTTTTTTNTNTGSLSGVNKVADDQISSRDEDAMRVMEGLVESKSSNSKRSRCVVFVGEYLSILEGAIEAAKCKVERGDRDVPELLKETKFMPLSLKHAHLSSREGVEEKVAEITWQVNKGAGVVLCVGDLDEFMRDVDRAARGKEYKYNYCPLDHMVTELRRLVNSDYCSSSDNQTTIANSNSNSSCVSMRLWLVGIATFQTYTRCLGKGAQYPNSLYSLCELHAITIPAAGSLDLSLNFSAGTPLTSKKENNNGNIGGFLVNPLELEDNNKMRTTSTLFINRICNSTSESTTDSKLLPSWLQKCKDENKLRSQSHDHQQEYSQVSVEDYPCRSWFTSSVCNTSQKVSHPSSETFERTLSFSCSIPPNSSSVPATNFSYSHSNNNFQSATQNQNKKNFICLNSSMGGNSTSNVHQPAASNSDQPPFFGTHNFYMPEPEPEPEEYCRRPQSQTPPVLSSSETMEIEEEGARAELMREYNTVENLNIFCDALEKTAPWLKDVIPDIASTVWHCRRSRRRLKNNLDDHEVKEETWLFFQGVDHANGKEKIARELARLVFGSDSKFVSIGLSSFSSSNFTRSSARDLHHYSVVVEDILDSGNKRLRDEPSFSYLERLIQAISNDPHRVFFLEDIDQLDYCSQMGIKRACERGKLKKGSSGEEVGLGDSIIILSSETTFISRSRACSPSMKQRLDHHHHLHLLGPMPITRKDDRQEEKNADYNMISTTTPSVSLDLNISISPDDHAYGTVDQLPSFDDIGLLAAVDKCISFKFS